MWAWKVFHSNRFQKNPYLGFRVWPSSPPHLGPCAVDDPSVSQGLGVGGSGHFAVWLDNDLFEGTSNQCHTFNSVSLASTSDFHVQALELWHIL